jgi:DNA-binding protein WhiA
VLSDEVRAELAAIEPRKACCRLAELSALMRGAGSIHLRGGGRIGLHLEVASPAVARRVFALLKGYGVPCEIHTFRRQAFERATRFRLLVADDARALQALNEAGIVDSRLVPLERPPRRVVTGLAAAPPTYAVPSWPQGRSAVPETLTSSCALRAARAPSSSRPSVARRGSRSLFTIGAVMRSRT